MNEFVTYILKVMAIQGVFYGVYWLFLRQSTKHSLNRWYLLGSLVLAFSIPFLEFSITKETPEIVHENPVIVWLSEPSTQEFDIIPVEQEHGFSWWSFLPWVVGLVAIILLVRSAVYLSILSKLKRHSVPIKKRWFTLFKTSQNRSFSFFSNVFIPRWLFGTEAFDQVLAHECVHVRQLHSVDRLLLDFIVSLFWFNPFIYLYRNALIEIHEFQADEAVIKEFNDPIAYQEILYSQLQSPQYSGLVSHFNFQMIKKRIVMMNKQKKRTSWIYTLTLPVTLLLIFAFSTKEATDPIEEVGEEISSFIDPAEQISTFSGSSQQNPYEPSILPLKEVDVIRMSSGFGMRMHPIYKVEKMHKGMDFACPTGTTVLAAADGTVHSAEEHDKYGNYILIDHGNEYMTRYAMLSEMEVTRGDRVKRGDVIGKSGNSGASTAPHLHYEVVKVGEGHVDPVDYIKNYKFKASSTREKNSRQDKDSELAQQQKELAQAQRKLAEEERMLAADHRERASAVSEKAEALRLMAEAERSALTSKTHREHHEQPEFDEQPDHQEYNDQEEIMKIDDSPDKKRKTKIKNKVKKKAKQKKKKAKQKFKVVLDPGHGGKDAGAIFDTEIKEKDATLRLASLVAEELEADKNIEVVLTRSGDAYLTLEDRVRLTEGADLLLSIHFDSHEDELTHFSSAVYYNGNEFSETSKMTAQNITEELAKLGVEARVGVSDGYYLTRKTRCPAVLVNVAYLPNDPYASMQDGASSYLANAIKKSIL